MCIARHTVGSKMVGHIRELHPARVFEWGEMNQMVSEIIY